jgi:hypothetical protein
MGNWVIHIEGTGCHHNGKEEIDADLLAPKLVKQLQDQGQTVEHATFTSGGRQSVIPAKAEG